jgi:hypothetical protein
MKLREPSALETTALPGLVLVLAAFLLGPCACACAGPSDYAAEREALIGEIERQVAATRHELGTDRLDPAVIAALRSIAADHVPQPLIDQLAPQGRLVMPVGEAGWIQQLVVMEKTEAGALKRKNVLPVRFVPVTLETAVGRWPGCVPGGVWQGTTRRNSQLLQRVVTQPGTVRCVHWAA